VPPSDCGDARRLQSGRTRGQTRATVAMAKTRDPRIDPAPAPTALSSLGDLLRQQGVAVAPASATGAAPLPAPGAGEPNLARCARLIVRRERKGHGGKTVTVVEGLPTAQLDALARLLRKALGCGSWVDDGRVVLQGDRLPAAETWLRRHGAPNVVRGT